MNIYTFLLLFCKLRENCSLKLYTMLIWKACSFFRENILGKNFIVRICTWFAHFLKLTLIALITQAKKNTCAQFSAKIGQSFLLKIRLINLDHGQNTLMQKGTVHTLTSNRRMRLLTMEDSVYWHYYSLLLYQSDQNNLPRSRDPAGGL